MTCIAAIEHDGKVWMGGDSAASSDYHLTIRADPKVFLNGPFLIGFTTSYRMGQLLRYKLTYPPRPEDIDDLKYLVMNFIDAVRDTFKESGLNRLEDGCEEGGQFLLGYRDRLYEVGSDYQVGMPASGIAAIGCGGDFARGSLVTSRSLGLNDPEAAITLALETAERCSAGVRGPWTILQSA